MFTGIKMELSSQHFRIGDDVIKVVNDLKDPDANTKT